MSAEPAPYALDPFGPSANPTAYVALRASEQAREALARALEAGRVAALLGPPGHGKTLLLRLVGAREEEHSRVAYLPMCSFEPAELFALVLHALGAPREADPRQGLLALAQRLAARGGVLLLVDDADAMPEASVAALAALVEEASGALRLVLAAVEGPKADRVCRAFAPWLTAVRLEEAMSVAEVHRYIETRLAYAGARPELVAAFDEETVAELHAASHGVPRQLNQLAQQIVRNASARSLPRLRDKLPPGPPHPAQGPVPLRPAPPGRAPAPATPEPEPDTGIFIAPLGELLPEPPRGEAPGAYRLVRERAGEAEPARTPPAAGGDEMPRLGRPVSGSDLRAFRTRTPEPATRVSRLAARVPALWLGAAAFAVGVAASIFWSDARDPVPGPQPPRAAAPAAPRAAAPSPPQQTTSAPLQPETLPEPIDAGQPAPQPSEPVGVPIAELPEAAPPPEPAAPAAVEPRVVQIAINATPWARIEIDGRDLGETPLAGIALEEGVHRFRAIMPDGSVRDQEIEIRDDVRTLVFE